MKKTKKLLSLVLASVMAASLVGCSKPADSKTSSAAKSGSTTSSAKSAASTTSTASTAEEAVEAKGHTITSPLVGTFYSSPSPDAPSFVNVGDRVKKGQVIGIIEAMKLMNELESDFDGVVKEILVKDETVVEFGQPLFILE